MAGLDLPVENQSRYLIYKLLGRKISFALRDKRRISGVVERVCRNIFENMIEITVNGKLFKFKEPTAIAFSSANKSAVVFVYGKTTEEEEAELSDQVLFAEMRASFYKGETINDVISRTTPEKKKVIRFTLLPV